MASSVSIRIQPGLVVRDGDDDRIRPVVDIEAVHNVARHEADRRSGKTPSPILDPVAALALEPVGDLPHQRMFVRRNPTEMQAFPLHHRLDMQEPDVEHTARFTINEEGGNIFASDHAGKSTSELPCLSMALQTLPT
jgi:hypothetical protein